MPSRCRFAFVLTNSAASPSHRCPAIKGRKRPGVEDVAARCPILEFRRCACESVEIHPKFGLNVNIHGQSGHPG